MTHICVSKLTVTGSDNGLSPSRRQIIIWTNAEILLIGSLGTNFSEISIEIYTFPFKKLHLKMSSGKWQPFCLGLNVLNTEWRRQSVMTTKHGNAARITGPWETHWSPADSPYKGPVTRTIDDSLMLHWQFFNKHASGRWSEIPLVSWPNPKQMGNSSYFRFDDDNKTKYIYSLIWHNCDAWHFSTLKLNALSPGWSRVDLDNYYWCIV